MQLVVKTTWRRLVGQLIGTDEGLHPELADGGGDQLLGVPHQHVDLRVGQFGVHLHALPVGEQREHGLFKYRISQLCTGPYPAGHILPPNLQCRFWRFRYLSKKFPCKSHFYNVCRGIFVYVYLMG